MQNARRSLSAVCLLAAALAWPALEAEAGSRGNIPSHGLIVASQSGLLSLRFDRSLKAYEKKAGAKLSGLSHVVLLDDRVFAAVGEELVSFTSGLKRKSAKKLGKIEALTAYGAHLFASAQKSLIAFDGGLNELSRLELVCRGWSKNAHDILIRRGTAYLLDNVMLPIFLFRADVRDPKAIRRIDRIEFTAINAHLDLQWLQPKLKQWVVLSSYAHRGGSGQVVRIHRMVGSKKPLATERIFSRQRIPEEKTEGTAILAATPLPPIWAVTRDAKGKASLSRVKTEKNRVRFKHMLALPDMDEDERVILKRKGNLLFMARRSGALSVIDLWGKPAVILTEDLSGLGARTLIDVLPN